MDYKVFLSFSRWLPPLRPRLFAFLSPPPSISASHPLSGLTPDELLLQALSLGLFELHKKNAVIGEGLTAKGIKKKKEYVKSQIMSSIVL